MRAVRLGGALGEKHTSLGCHCEPMKRPSTRKVVERFKELGMDIGQPLTPEQLSQSLRVASDKHGANLKGIGFKPE